MGSEMCIRDSNDSESIRQAIMSLMEKEELKLRLGESARRTIVDSYSLDCLVEKELKLMEALLGT